jgi:hypothetical protein
MLVRYPDASEVQDHLSSVIFTIESLDGTQGAFTCV